MCCISMPQLDTFSYWYQTSTATILILYLYIYLSLVVLPKIACNLKYRIKKLGSSLKEITSKACFKYLLILNKLVYIVKCISLGIYKYYHVLYRLGLNNYKVTVVTKLVLLVLRINRNLIKESLKLHLYFSVL